MHEGVVGSVGGRKDLPKSIKRTVIKLLVIVQQMVFLRGL